MQITAHFHHPAGAVAQETFSDLFALAQRLRSLSPELHGRTFLEGCSENDTRHLFALLAGDGRVIFYAQPRLSRDMREVKEGWNGSFGQPIRSGCLWLTH